MNAQTLKALKDCIAHWKRFEKGEQRRDEGIGQDSCALCGIYNNTGVILGCGKCPVKLKTGEHYCKASPWEKARAEMFLHGFSSPEFKAASKKERLFLESLLPKRKRA